MNVSPAIRELETEKTRIEEAINLLHSLNGSKNGHKPGRRTMSASARRRIGLAQKKRWKEWKAAKKK